MIRIDSDSLPGLACAYFFTFLFGRIPRYGFGHETDHQKCYGRKNTGNFGVSAIRIQWTTQNPGKKVKTLLGLPEQSWDVLAGFASYPAPITESTTKGGRPKAATFCYRSASKLQVLLAKYNRGLLNGGLVQGGLMWGLCFIFIIL